jgi:LPXTG-motif cell wall-anchored protein
MKKLSALIATIVSGAQFLMAQDSTATYIENLSVQDSTEIKAQMQGAAEQASGSGSNTSLIIMIVAVVVLLVVFVLLRKKRKK